MALCNMTHQRRGLDSLFVKPVRMRLDQKIESNKQNCIPVYIAYLTDMLKLKYLLFTLPFTCSLFAIAQVDLNKANKSNTWPKIGMNMALPILDFGETQSVGLGVDASVQFLETKASGIGLKIGYLNYFGKGNNDDVSVIPLAIMYRYYPESKGWFSGLELGYAFINGLSGTSGGIFIRPKLGLHYDIWNFYGYYDQIVIEESGFANLQAIGLGITYNVRFK